MRYLTKELIFFFMIFLFLGLRISAQEITILDKDNGTPVSNVAVFNDDKTISAISDLNGKVLLDDFSARDKIEFRHISFRPLSLTKETILRRNRVVYLQLKPEELEEVVMSISKWEQQRRDIPQKIATINAGSVAFANPQTSADILQQSGKVFVQKSQLGGGSPMIRGFATNRLLLSVDGVRMNNAIFRGGNLQNVISIDPFTVRNIEVIFGPGSVIYGSDAIGGVMNFYTKRPRFAYRDSLLTFGQVYYRHGTAGTENTAHAEFGFGKKQWAFLSSVSYNDFGDLKMGSHGPDVYLRQNYVTGENGNDELTLNPDPEKQVPTGYSQLSLMQKISFRPNNNWNYNLGLHYSETSDYSRYDRLIRPDRNGDGLRSAEWYYGPQKWFMGNMQLINKGKNSFYDGLKITTAYQFFEESRYDRGFGDEIRFGTREKVDAYSVNLDLENKNMGKLGIFYGVEYIANQVDSEGSELNADTGTWNEGPSRYPDNSTWETLAGYINGEYKFKPNVTFLSGLRYSHVWIDAVFDTRFYPFPFDETKITNGALTGSLGVSWLPAEHVQLTLNGSTGFRSPNIDDIGKVFDSEPGAVVVPNPNLEPEYAYNVEMGIQKNFNDRLILNGTVYYTYLVDALVRRDYNFNGDAEIPYNGELSRVQAIQNAARAYVYGFEFGLDARLNDYWSVRGNLVFTEGIEEDDDGMDSASRHAAPTFADIHLLWNRHNIRADFFLNYNGEISFEDLSLSERSKTYIYASDANGNPYSPSWYTLNLRSQYTFKENFRLSLLAENLTDQRYRPYSSGIAAAGRNFILGLGYTF